MTDQTKDRSPEQQKLLDRIGNDFTYHSPPTDRVADFKLIRDTAGGFAATLIELVPMGRELSTALTKLEEAVMHANAGIARHPSEERV